MMVKILSVFGTRPEAIKMAPVLKELASHSDRIVSKVCVTGQHREMLDQVLNLFGIVPEYDLKVMENAQSPSQVAAAVISRLEPLIMAEQPDWVLVQGDTTTVAAASVTAFFCGARVGHVEAGLRTHDKRQPFPEEINRRLAGVVADLHFAPTTQAMENLLQEKVPADAIRLTGNTIIDALHMVGNMHYDLASGPLSFVPWDKRIILVTAHRRENFGQPIAEICAALKELALRYRGELQIVFPVHPNPNVFKPVHQCLSGVDGIALIAPLDYLPMVYLMKRSELVLTDSGGIQEEAPALGKPVLVLRDVTERPEAVLAGTSRLVGTNKADITRWVSRLLEDKTEYARMARATNPYGDGQAAKRIAQALLDRAGETK